MDYTQIAETFIPLGRVSETSDLEGFYHFLAAEESAFLTGQAIAVDGGMSLGVRHLGSIYEGLLEFKLRTAPEKMAIVKGKKTEEFLAP